MGLAVAEMAVAEMAVLLALVAAVLATAFFLATMALLLRDRARTAPSTSPAAP